MSEEENGDEPGGIPSPQEKKNDSKMNMEDEKAIDYVLVHETNKDEESEEKARLIRETFLKNLKQEGLEILERIEKEGEIFIELHAPLNLLKKFEGVLKMRLPIRKSEEEEDDEHLDDEPDQGFLQSWIQRTKETK